MNKAPLDCDGLAAASFCMHRKQDEEALPTPNGWSAFDVAQSPSAANCTCRRDGSSRNNSPSREKNAVELLVRMLHQTEPALLIFQDVSLKSVRARNFGDSIAVHVL